MAPPVAPRSSGNGRGDAFSPAGKRTSDTFERLWSVWPVKKDRAVSRRIFLSLSRARRLPGLDALLAIVARFKATDRHWRNGCAPLLSSWLRGERWLDEPYAPQADNTTPSTPALSPEMAERLRRCAARVTERPADPTLEASRPAFEAMLEHFPDGRRKRGPA